MSLGHSHHHSHDHAHGHDHGEARDAKVMRIGQISLAVAVLVIAFKVVAWRLSGSVALFSDVLESITHILTASITLLALKISHRPADRDHPYGHHKAEYFSAMIEAAFIVVAAALVLYEAVPHLWAPVMPTLNTWVIVTTTIATLGNGGWAFYLIGRGKIAGSPALSADGWHLITDAATSIGVLVGLALAWATGWAILDPLIACVVAVHILWAGYNVMHGAMSSLLDKAAGRHVESHIHEVVTSHAGDACHGIHALKTRVAGRATFIEFHLLVDENMSVKDSHKLCDKLEKALTDHIRGAQVTIHVEPAGTEH